MGTHVARAITPRPPEIFEAERRTSRTNLARSSTLKILRAHLTPWSVSTQARTDSFGTCGFAFCALAPAPDDALDGVLCVMTPDARWDAGDVAARPDAPNCAATFELKVRPGGAWRCPWDQLAADADADPAVADLVADLAARFPALADARARGGGV